jgi:hypothetical protein
MGVFGGACSKKGKYEENVKFKFERSSLGKKQLTRPDHTWKYNIKIDLR